MGAVIEFVSAKSLYPTSLDLIEDCIAKLGENATLQEALMVVCTLSDLGLIAKHGEYLRCDLVRYDPINVLKHAMGERH
jgi:hypothetical protein